MDSDCIDIAFVESEPQRSRVIGDEFNLSVFARNFDSVIKKFSFERHHGRICESRNSDFLPPQICGRIYLTVVLNIIFRAARVNARREQNLKTVFHRLNRGRQKVKASVNRICRDEFAS